MTHQTTHQTPSVGRIVHYVSYGTPGGEYKSECRAAVVAAVSAEMPDAYVDLVVLNPTGLFFNQQCAYHESDVGRDYAGAEIPGHSYQGGTWHWPEQV